MVVLRDFLFDVVEIFDRSQFAIQTSKGRHNPRHLQKCSKGTAGEDDKKVCNYFKCLKFQYYSPVLRHISSEVEHVG